MEDRHAEPVAAMPDLPVAAPDPAQIVQDALDFVESGDYPEPGTEDAARAAFAALLVERQQAEERIERLTELIRELLWAVADLARSRKTGALQALALDLVGVAPTDQRQRSEVRRDIAAVLAGEEGTANG